MSRSNKKKNKKHRNREKRSALQVLTDRVNRTFHDYDGGGVILGKTTDGVKMSEVLEDFVEPYREFAATEDAYRTLLTTAMIAWNVALMPESERIVLLEELLGTVPQDFRKAGREIIGDLMVRKEQSFPQYRRWIIDFQLMDAGDRSQLYVISTPGPV